LDHNGNYCWNYGADWRFNLEHIPIKNN